MKNPGSAPLRAFTAGLVIIAAGAGGYFAFRSMNDATPAAGLVPAPPAPTADATTVAPDAEPPKRVVPDLLPDVTLGDRSGRPTKLASFGGRPLMVNFWATWCAPCRREIPLLNRLRREREAQNVEIVGIAVDFRDKVLEFMEKVPVEYPVLIGEEDGYAAANAFGMELLLPFSVFIDSQNRILTVKIGELHEDEANYALDRLRDIDDGTLTRAAAQARVATAFKEMATARVKAASAGPGDHDHSPD